MILSFRAPVSQAAGRRFLWDSYFLVDGFPPADAAYREGAQPSGYARAFVGACRLGAVSSMRLLRILRARTGDDLCNASTVRLLTAHH
jgi:hypothetical protein